MFRGHILWLWASTCENVGWLPRLFGHLAAGLVSAALSSNSKIVQNHYVSWYIRNMHTFIYLGHIFFRTVLSEAPPACFWAPQTGPRPPVSWGPRCVRGHFMGPGSYFWKSGPPKLKIGPKFPFAGARESDSSGFLSLSNLSKIRCFLGFCASFQYDNYKLRILVL